jgi:hypothetical protein
MKPTKENQTFKSCFNGLISILFFLSLSNFLLAQNFEDKILSSELWQLIADEPEKERIVIIMIKPDDYIRELQLKSETKSPFIELPYMQRAQMALSTAKLRNSFEELLKHGTPYTFDFENKTQSYLQTSNSSYFLFMNAYTFKIALKNIEDILQLPFVSRLIDGEAEMKISNNAINRNNKNSIKDVSKGKSVLNTSTYWDLIRFWNIEHQIYEWDYEVTDVAELHDMNIKGQGTKIAILDTGIEYEHPAVNLLFNSNNWDNTKLNVAAVQFFTPWIWSANDVNGHGTNVAGMAWKMAPMAEFFISKIAYGVTINYSNYAQAIDWALNHNVDLIVTSFIGEQHSECPSELTDWDVTIENANNQKTMTVSASGNNSLYPISPGYGSQSLAVYSIMATETFPEIVVTYSQNNSPQNPCYSYNKPDIAAPGRNLTTLDLVDNNATGITY